MKKSTEKSKNQKKKLEESSTKKSIIKLNELKQTSNNLSENSKIINNSQTVRQQNPQTLVLNSSDPETSFIQINESVTNEENKNQISISKTEGLEGVDRKSFNDSFENRSEVNQLKNESVLNHSKHNQSDNESFVNNSITNKLDNINQSEILNPDKQVSKDHTNNISKISKEEQSISGATKTSKYETKLTNPNVNNNVKKPIQKNQDINKNTIVNKNIQNSLDKKNNNKNQDGLTGNNQLVQRNSRDKLETKVTGNNQLVQRNSRDKLETKVTGNNQLVQRNSRDKLETKVTGNNQLVQRNSRDKLETKVTGNNQLVQRNSRDKLETKVTGNNQLVQRNSRDKLETKVTGNNQLVQRNSRDKLETKVTGNNQLVQRNSRDKLETKVTGNNQLVQRNSRDKLETKVTGNNQLVQRNSRDKLETKVTGNNQLVQRNSRDKLETKVTGNNQLVQRNSRDKLETKVTGNNQLVQRNSRDKLETKVIKHNKTGPSFPTKKVDEYSNNPLKIDHTIHANYSDPTKTIHPEKKPTKNINPEIELETKPFIKKNRKTKKKKTIKPIYDYEDGSILPEEPLPKKFKFLKKKKIEENENQKTKTVKTFTNANGDIEELELTNDEHNKNDDNDHNNDNDDNDNDYDDSDLDQDENHNDEEDDDDEDDEVDNEEYVDEIYDKNNENKGNSKQLNNKLKQGVEGQLDTNDEVLMIETDKNKYDKANKNNEKANEQWNNSEMIDETSGIDDHIVMEIINNEIINITQEDSNVLPINGKKISKIIKTKHIESPKINDDYPKENRTEKNKIISKNEREYNRKKDDNESEIINTDKKENNYYDDVGKVDENLTLSQPNEERNNNNDEFDKPLNEQLNNDHDIINDNNLKIENEDYNRNLNELNDNDINPISNEVIEDSYQMNKIKHSLEESNYLPLNMKNGGMPIRKIKVNKIKKSDANRVDSEESVEMEVDEHANPMNDLAQITPNIEEELSKSEPNEGITISKHQKVDENGNVIEEIETKLIRKQLEDSGHIPLKNKEKINLKKRISKNENKNDFLNGVGENATDFNKETDMNTDKKENNYYDDVGKVDENLTLSQPNEERNNNNDEFDKPLNEQLNNDHDIINDNNLKIENEDYNRNLNELNDNDINPISNEVIEDSYQMNKIKHSLEESNYLPLNMKNGGMPIRKIKVNKIKKSDANRVDSEESVEMEVDEHANPMNDLAQITPNIEEELSKSEPNEGITISKHQKVDENGNVIEEIETKLIRKQLEDSGHIPLKNKEKINLKKRISKNENKNDFLNGVGENATDFNKETDMNTDKKENNYYDDVGKVDENLTLSQPNEERNNNNDEFDKPLNEQLNNDHDIINDNNLKIENEDYNRNLNELNDNDINPISNEVIEDSYQMNKIKHSLEESNYLPLNMKNGGMPIRKIKVNKIKKSDANRVDSEESVEMEVDEHANPMNDLAQITPNIEEELSKSEPNEGITISKHQKVDENGNVIEEIETKLIRKQLEDSGHIPLKNKEKINLKKRISKNENKNDFLNGVGENATDFNKETDMNTDKKENNYYDDVGKVDENLTLSQPNEERNNNNDEFDKPLNEQLNNDHDIINDNNLKIENEDYNRNLNELNDNDINPISNEVIEDSYQMNKIKHSLEESNYLPLNMKNGGMPIRKIKVNKIKKSDANRVDSEESVEMEVDEHANPMNDLAQITPNIEEELSKSEPNEGITISKHQKVDENGNVIEEIETKLIRKQLEDSGHIPLKNKEKINLKKRISKNENKNDFLNGVGENATDFNKETDMNTDKKENNYYDDVGKVDENLTLSQPNEERNNNNDEFDKPLNEQLNNDHDIINDKVDNPLNEQLNNDHDIINDKFDNPLNEQLNNDHDIINDKFDNPLNEQLNNDHDIIDDKFDNPLNEQLNNDHDIINDKVDNPLNERLNNDHDIINDNNPNTLISPVGFVTQEGPISHAPEYLSIGNQDNKDLQPIDLLVHNNTTLTSPSSVFVSNDIIETKTYLNNQSFGYQNLKITETTTTIVTETIETTKTVNPLIQLERVPLKENSFNLISKQKRSNLENQNINITNNENDLSNEFINHPQSNQNIIVMNVNTPEIHNPNDDYLQNQFKMNIQNIEKPENNSNIPVNELYIEDNDRFKTIPDYKVREIDRINNPLNEQLNNDHDIINDKFDNPLNEQLNNDHDIIDDKFDNPLNEQLNNDHDIINDKVDNPLNERLNNDHDIINDNNPNTLISPVGFVTQEGPISHAPEYLSIGNQDNKDLQPIDLLVHNNTTLTSPSSVFVSNDIIETKTYLNNQSFGYQNLKITETTTTIVTETIETTKTVNPLIQLERVPLKENSFNLISKQKRSNLENQNINITNNENDLSNEFINHPQSNQNIIVMNVNTPEIHNPNDDYLQNQFKMNIQNIEKPENNSNIPVNELYIEDNDRFKTIPDYKVREIDRINNPLNEQLNNDHDIINDKFDNPLNEQLNNDHDIIDDKFDNPLNEQLNNDHDIINDKVDNPLNERLNNDHDIINDNNPNTLISPVGFVTQEGPISHAPEYLSIGNQDNKDLQPIDLLVHNNTTLTSPSSVFVSNDIIETKTYLNNQSFGYQNLKITETTTTIVTETIETTKTVNPLIQLERVPLKENSFNLISKQKRSNLENQNINITNNENDLSNEFINHPQSNQNIIVMNVNTPEIHNPNDDYLQNQFKMNIQNIEKPENNSNIPVNELYIEDNDRFKTIPDYKVREIDRINNPLNEQLNNDHDIINDKFDNPLNEQLNNDHDIINDKFDNPLNERLNNDHDIINDKVDNQLNEQLNNDHDIINDKFNNPLNEQLNNDHDIINDKFDNPLNEQLNNDHDIINDKFDNPLNEQLNNDHDIIDDKFDNPLNEQLNNDHDIINDKVDNPLNERLNNDHDIINDNNPNTLISPVGFVTQEGPISHAPEYLSIGNQDNKDLQPIDLLVHNNTTLTSPSSVFVSNDIIETKTYLNNQSFGYQNLKITETTTTIVTETIETTKTVNPLIQLERVPLKENSFNLISKQKRSNLENQNINITNNENDLSNEFINHPQSNQNIIVMNVNTPEIHNPNDDYLQNQFKMNIQNIEKPENNSNIPVNELYIEDNDRFKTIPDYKVREIDRINNPLNEQLNNDHDIINDKFDNPLNEQLNNDHDIIDDKFDNPLNEQLNNDHDIINDKVDNPLNERLNNDHDIINDNNPNTLISPVGFVTQEGPISHAPEYLSIGNQDNKDLQPIDLLVHNNTTLTSPSSVFVSNDIIETKTYLNNQSFGYQNLKITETTTTIVTETIETTKTVNPLIQLERVPLKENSFNLISKQKRSNLENQNINITNNENDLSNEFINHPQSNQNIIVMNVNTPEIHNPNDDYLQNQFKMNIQNIEKPENNSNIPVNELYIEDNDRFKTIPDYKVREIDRINNPLNEQLNNDHDIINDKFDNPLNEQLNNDHDIINDKFDNPLNEQLNNDHDIINDKFDNPLNEQLNNDHDIIDDKFDNPLNEQLNNDHDIINDKVDNPLNERLNNDHDIINDNNPNTLISPVGFVTQEGPISHAPEYLSIGNQDNKDLQPIDLLVHNNTTLTSPSSVFVSNDIIETKTYLNNQSFGYQNLKITETTTTIVTETIETTKTVNPLIQLERVPLKENSFNLISKQKRSNLENQNINITNNENDLSNEFINHPQSNQNIIVMNVNTPEIHNPNDDYLQNQFKMNIQNIEKPENNSNIPVNELYIEDNDRFKTIPDYKVREIDRINNPLNEQLNNDHDIINDKFDNPLNEQLNNDHDIIDDKFDNPLNEQLNNDHDIINDKFDNPLNERLNNDHDIINDNNPNTLISPVGFVTQEGPISHAPEYLSIGNQDNKDLQPIDLLVHNNTTLTSPSSVFVSNDIIETKTYLNNQSFGYQNLKITETTTTIVTETIETTKTVNPLIQLERVPLKENSFNLISKQKRSNLENQNINITNNENDLSNEFINHPQSNQNIIVMNVNTPEIHNPNDDYLQNQFKMNIQNIEKPENNSNIPVNELYIEDNDRFKTIPDYKVREIDRNNNPLNEQLNNDEMNFNIPLSFQTPSLHTNLLKSTDNALFDYVNEDDIEIISIDSLKNIQTIQNLHQKNLSQDVNKFNTLSPLLEFIPLHKIENIEQDFPLQNQTSESSKNIGEYRSKLNPEIPKLLNKDDENDLNSNELISLQSEYLKFPLERLQSNQIANGIYLDDTIELQNNFDFSQAREVNQPVSSLYQKKQFIISNTENDKIISNKDQSSKEDEIKEEINKNQYIIYKTPLEDNHVRSINEYHQNNNTDFHIPSQTIDSIQILNFSETQKDFSQIQNKNTNLISTITPSFSNSLNISPEGNTYDEHNSIISTEKNRILFHQSLPQSTEIKIIPVTNVTISETNTIDKISTRLNVDENTSENKKYNIQLQNIPITGKPTIEDIIKKDDLLINTEMMITGKPTIEDINKKNYLLINTEMIITGKPTREDISKKNDLLINTEMMITGKPTTEDINKKNYLLINTEMIITGKPTREDINKKNDLLINTEMMITGKPTIIISDVKTDPFRDLINNNNNDIKTQTKMSIEEINSIDQKTQKSEDAINQIKKENEKSKTSTLIIPNQSYPKDQNVLSIPNEELMSRTANVERIQINFSSVEDHKTNLNKKQNTHLNDSIEKKMHQNDNNKPIENLSKTDHNFEIHQFSQNNKQFGLLSENKNQNEIKTHLNEKSNTTHNISFENISNFDASLNNLKTHRVIVKQYEVYGEPTTVVRLGEKKHIGYGESVIKEITQRTFYPNEIKSSTHQNTEIHIDSLQYKVYSILLKIETEETKINQLNRNSNYRNSVFILKPIDNQELFKTHPFSIDQQSEYLLHPDNKLINRTPNSYSQNLPLESQHQKTINFFNQNSNSENKLPLESQYQKTIHILNQNTNSENKLPLKSQHQETDYSYIENNNTFPLNVHGDTKRNFHKTENEMIYESQNKLRPLPNNQSSTSETNHKNEELNFTSKESKQKHSTPDNTISYQNQKSIAFQNSLNPHSQNVIFENKIFQKPIKQTITHNFINHDTNHINHHLYNSDIPLLSKPFQPMYTPGITSFDQSINNSPLISSLINPTLVITSTQQNNSTETNLNFNMPIRKSKNVSSLPDSHFLKIENQFPDLNPNTKPYNQSINKQLHENKTNEISTEIINQTQSNEMNPKNQKGYLISNIPKNTIPFKTKPSNQTLIGLKTSPNSTKLLPTNAQSNSSNPSHVFKPFNPPNQSSVIHKPPHNSQNLNLSNPPFHDNSNFQTIHHSQYSNMPLYINNYSPLIHQSQPPHQPHNINTNSHVLYQQSLPSQLYSFSNNHHQAYQPFVQHQQSVINNDPQMTQNFIVQNPQSILPIINHSTLNSPNTHVNTTLNINENLKNPKLSNIENQNINENLKGAKTSNIENQNMNFTEMNKMEIKNKNIIGLRLKSEKEQNQINYENIPFYTIFNDTNNELPVDVSLRLYETIYYELISKYNQKTINELKEHLNTIKREMEIKSKEFEDMKYQNMTNLEMNLMRKHYFINLINNYLFVKKKIHFGENLNSNHLNSKTTHHVINESFQKKHFNDRGSVYPDTNNGNSTYNMELFNQYGQRVTTFQSINNVNPAFDEELLNQYKHTVLKNNRSPVNQVIEKEANLETRLNLKEVNNHRFTIDQEKTIEVDKKSIDDNSYFHYFILNFLNKLTNKYSKISGKTLKNKGIQNKLGNDSLSLDSIPINEKHVTFELNQVNTIISSNHLTQTKDSAREENNRCLIDKNNEWFIRNYLNKLYKKSIKTVIKNQQKVNVTCNSNPNQNEVFNNITSESDYKKLIKQLCIQNLSNLTQNVTHSLYHDSNQLNKISGITLNNKGIQNKLGNDSLSLDNISINEKHVTFELNQVNTIISSNHLTQTKDSAREENNRCLIDKNNEWFIRNYLNKLYNKSIKTVIKNQQKVNVTCNSNPNQNEVFNNITSESDYKKLIKQLCIQNLSNLTQNVTHSLHHDSNQLNIQKNFVITH